jgi:hypothetical protein
MIGHCHPQRVSLAVASTLALVGCSPDPDFDGLYRVESYTLTEASCAEPGVEIEREFPKFRIKGRDWFGVTLYPVYPCDEDDVCAEENLGTWGLVTVEEDLDQVSSVSAGSGDDSCVLQSVDLVIEGAEGEVVLQSRTYELVLEPYDPATCTTDNAKARRGAMQCVRILQLVGAAVSE